MDIWALCDLCTPWCIHAVGTLRIAQHMAGGLTTLDDLAAASHSHAESLGRVLRHLAGKGLFAEPEPGRFVLNDAARGLLDPSLHLALDLDGIGGRMARVWSGLPSAVATGRPAYGETFGRSFWDDLEANPPVAATFDALMGPAGHGAPDPAIPLSGGWDSVRTVVDVGGGTGSLLAEILRANPAIRGILVDLPRTVARSAETFAAAGVADRVTTIGQSFFDPLPAGADVYLMKNVLADWPDREAAALLARCAEAARPNGRVVVLGGVCPDGSTPYPDLLMLVLVGGKQRTISEFRVLAAAAGLDVVSATAAARFVVECRPAVS